VHRIRVLRPAANIFAFYDGRIDGYRFAEGPNWVDDGALSLGISSYAVVDDGEALIYDTHVSVEHARFIRKALLKLKGCGYSRSSSAIGTSITLPHCGVPGLRGGRKQAHG
jgi:hypothetical protein